MLKYRIPDDREAGILRENRLDPDEYAIIFSDENTIHLLCYISRDTITIQKGDRKWS